MSAAAGNESLAKEILAVRGLNLQRYMGRWYEIACFPSTFQPRDGRGTRATYSLRGDGTVRVLNETWSAGRRAAIEGTAFFADDSAEGLGEARLRVRFYVPPFFPVIPVVGDYWVLHVDEEYQYALVGQPSRKFLWFPGPPKVFTCVKENTLWTSSMTQERSVPNHFNCPLSRILTSAKLLVLLHYQTQASVED